MLYQDYESEFDRCRKLPENWAAYFEHLPSRISTELTHLRTFMITIFNEAVGNDYTL